MNKCETCGFELWNHIPEPLPVSSLGLYSDNRFPGRSILKLNTHKETLEDLEPELLTAFMLDVQKAVKVLKQVTGSNRINVAVLGNTVPHVHAHRIPRYPETETFPGKSPWNDPRPLQPLTVTQQTWFLTEISAALKN